MRNKDNIERNLDRLTNLLNTLDYSIKRNEQDLYLNTRDKIKDILDQISIYMNQEEQN